MMMRSKEMWPFRQPFLNGFYQMRILSICCIATTIWQDSSVLCYSSVQGMRSFPTRQVISPFTMDNTGVYLIGLMPDYFLTLIRPKVECWTGTTPFTVWPQPLNALGASAQYHHLICQNYSVILITWRPWYDLNNIRNNRRWSTICWRIDWGQCNASSTTCNRLALIGLGIE